MAELAHPKPRNMRCVLKASLLATTLFYGVVAVAGCLLFGSSIEEDVLSNLTVRPCPPVRPAPRQLSQLKPRHACRPSFH